MYDNLFGRFASAGLELRLASLPFARGAGSADIFQMDIRRARPKDARSEHFLVWPGQGDNNAVVQGTDRDMHQLVLMIREGHRDFEETIPTWIVRAIPHAPGSALWRTSIAARAGVRPELVIVHKGGAAIRRETRGSTRHMLVGRDERQLFMCELPKPCTTVKAAHDALRVPAARTRSKSALDQPIRQGEWFFIVVPHAESSFIDEGIAKNTFFVRRKTSINSVIPRAGKPHVVDELVVTRADVDRSGRRHPVVYVRGAVRHVDHRTIHIPRWRRVLRNLEVDQGRSPLGGTWID
jgi:hypothetical protein